MAPPVPKTVPLGELILTAFDKAAKYSADLREVARLATSTISHIFRHSRHWQRSGIKHAQHLAASTNAFGGAHICMS